MDKGDILSVIDACAIDINEQFGRQQKETYLAWTTSLANSAPILFSLRYCSPVAAVMAVKPKS